MILERTPPLIRDELNETQLSMLKQCEISGLLPLETEECDGHVSLRYALSGQRMLTEALRTTSWSMSDMLGALCRLAEVLEECRLFFLDADRVRLLDEFIFVGDEWHDLKLTYLPIDMPTLHRADDLERLIMRWVIKVKEPDGQVLQSLLRLVGSSGFTPLLLIRYVRQHLASLQVAQVRVSPTLAAPVEVPPVSELKLPKPIHTKQTPSWNILRPVSGDLHPVSEIWGDGSESKLGNFPSAKGSVKRLDRESSQMDIGRWRIVIVCVSFFLIAVLWRFIYLNQPSQPKLLSCLCLTLLLCAGVFYLWSGIPARLKKIRSADSEPSNQAINDSFKSICSDKAWDEPQNRVAPRFPTLSSNSSSRKDMASSDSENFPQSVNEWMDSQSNRFSSKEQAHPSSSAQEETTWISASNDQTAYLNNKQTSPQDEFCLVWKSKEAGYRIPLRGKSLVIGRSSEAAQHVDETMGISRAHVELAKVADQWKVKDLGSRNGSRLNDKPMTAYEWYTLQIGDCLMLANSHYCFQQGDS